MSREIQSDLLGRQLGLYELVDVVGSGPYGTVYRARDLKEVEAWRAVKVMMGPIADLTTFKFRLPNEMRTAVQLSHPHILPVYQFGSDEGLQYVAMEYVDSVSLDVQLRQVTPERRYSDPAVHQCLRSIARALDYANSQRVVHANVKPSNILLRTGDRHPLLTDFCIARAVSVERIAEAGITIDCAFRSPEQCAAPGVDATPASDVYSLAAVLWYVTTGSPPFGSGMEARAGHVDGALPDLKLVAPHVPPGLPAVLARGLAKAPGQRYQRADHLVREFISAAAAPAVPVAVTVPAPTVRTPFTPVVQTAAPVTPSPSPPPPPPPVPGPRPRPQTARRTFFAPAAAIELRHTAEWRPFPGEVREKPEENLVLLWIMGALLAAILVATTASGLLGSLLRPGATTSARAGTPPPVAPTIAATAPPVTARGSLPAPVAGLIGNPMRVAGMRVTVVSEAASAPGARPVPSPRPGERFFAVEVLYENASGRPSIVSPYDWVVTDSSGTVYGAVEPGLPSDLTERMLPNGGEARGLVGFVVPQSASGLSLHYASEVGDEGAVVQL